MRIIIFMLFISFGLLSCGNNETQQKEQTTATQEKTEHKKINKNTQTQVDYIIKEINSVTTEEDLRKAFMKYLDYASQIDNNTAKSYASFAYDYLLNKPETFLSVINTEDSIKIDKWATIASGKMIFDMAKIEDPSSYIEKCKKEHLSKAKKLNESQKKLYERYINKLIWFATPKK